MAAVFSYAIRLRFTPSARRNDAKLKHCGAEEEPFAFCEDEHRWTRDQRPEYAPDQIKLLPGKEQSLGKINCIFGSIHEYSIISPLN